MSNFITLLCLRTPVFAALLFASGAAGAQAIEPDAFDFGDVVVGDQSGPQAFIVTNVQPSQVTVTDVSLIGAGADQFSIQDTDCVGVIPPAGQCEVSVVFAPTAAGSAQAVLLVGVTNVSGNLARDDAPLAGNGLPPATETADLRIELQLDDISVTPGQSLVLSAEVDNLGPDDAVAVVAEISVAGAVTDSLIATGAGWTCELSMVTVTCTMPLLAALQTAPISIAFDATDDLGSYEIGGNVQADTNDPDLVNNADTIAFDVTDAPPPSLPVPSRIPATGDLAALLMILGALAVAWRSRQR